LGIGPALLTFAEPPSIHRQLSEKLGTAAPSQLRPVAKHPAAGSFMHKRHSQIESGRCRTGLIENGRERQKTHSCHCRIRSPRLQYALHSGVGGRPESTHGCRLQISTQETVVSSIADVPARGIRHALHRETADGRKAPATVVARELVDGLRSKSASRAIDRTTALICAQTGLCGV
jgi:hypothetical protein